MEIEIMIHRNGILTATLHVKTKICVDIQQISKYKDHTNYYHYSLKDPRLMQMLFQSLVSEGVTDMEEIETRIFEILYKTNVTDMLT